MSMDIKEPRRGMPDQVRVLQVIEVTVLRGAGTDDDLVRLVKQYWHHEDGVSQLLAEFDPYLEEFSPAVIERRS